MPNGTAVPEEDELSPLLRRMLTEAIRLDTAQKATSEHIARERRRAARAAYLTGLGMVLEAMDGRAGSRETAQAAGWEFLRKYQPQAG